MTYGFQQQRDVRGKSLMDNTKNSIESPTSAEAYVDRGNEFYDQGDYQAAISDYDEAIRVNPEYAEAYSKRGNAKSKLGKTF